ncbi:hypothetical protein [Aminivibrio sp.]|uniref:hypothetical protein n=1 Tax=Aminivibrio sp. TaxID=1872489 RepID=UPI001A5047A5|nr:hypothetical protein [Aminivibrio sp.]MBL3538225.1 hypothetical protein [Aminivibrio sp.]MDK2958653.1 hypothetical protein [Synergistaceae bacterium]
MGNKGEGSVLTFRGTPNRRELDQLLAAGEQQSAPLMAMKLGRQGCPGVEATRTSVVLSTPRDRPGSSAVDPQGVGY